MIFNTFTYFILFLVPSAILFRLVRPAAQPWVCITFGASFFVFFSLTQVGGAFGAACLLIFIWESIFSRFYKQGSVLCIVGIVQTIIFLIIFKYWNFLTGLAFGSPQHNPFFWAGAFLPLGISFFTFEFIHYAVDSYRGTTPPGKFREYMAFILFFPTMVAGPIKRYQTFLPSLREPSLEWSSDWRIGMTRLLVGLAKKFAIADLMTAFTNHLNHADIAKAQRWVLPLWVLAYGIKIYFDFSAYSDIAIGSARLFGMKVPENFDWPYARTNIAEFWKHWHISLYRWLLDYVFIPLGGSRCKPPRVLVNLLITMFLSGLWHGAGLNFIAWGLWHGLLLAVHRTWSKWRGAHPQPPSVFGTLAAWAITFVTVNLGWAFFCMDLPTAAFFLKRLFCG
ncbi:MAG TPA: MBOAT family O-acyltransferase [Verrucomicrobiae bacterium]|jgi:alginate O-acetyltransferase complex protein AlgI|nr:MBOAT family O-acyltransferase [Verrucomicrobiae bacterium]